MHKRANGRALLRELAGIQAAGGVSFGDLCYFKSNSHLNVVRLPPHVVIVFALPGYSGKWMHWSILLIAAC